MKEKFKNFRWDSIVIAIASIVLGIILIVFPEITLKTLGYAIGIGIIVLGVISIIFYLARESSDNLNRHDFLLGTVEIVIGICAIIKIAIIIDLLPIAMGIIIIISGCAKLQDTVDLLRAKTGNWIVLFIFSIICIGAGIVLIYNPFDSMKVLFVLIGVALTFSGATDIFRTIYLNKKIGKSR